MAYNPGIAYRGPDGATRSVTDELTARFGYPARPYEFVTGWKDAGNVSGHNPDSNGITHGVDIFLTQSQNRWAADHLAARGRAGDPRVAYVIYAGQIASPSTGYEFAGSGWEHWDHPHLSVWDGYWGGHCSLPSNIYNDTSSWGIAGATPQANTITPIIPKEDTLSAAEVNTIMDGIASMEAGIRQNIRDHFLEGSTTGSGDNKTWRPGVTKIVIENQRRLNASNAKLAALETVVGQLAKGQGVTIDYDKINKSIKAALADGIEITGTIAAKDGAK